jgi:FAD/FMN-containing dehydrogenase
MAMTGVGASPLELNDAQSGLNPTVVREIVTPGRTEDVAGAVQRAARDGLAVSVSGSRHAMGGQQFASDALHIDMRGMRSLLELDGERGMVTAEAGMEWAELLPAMVELQAGRDRQWGIRQKQTGSDHLSLGGAVASNIHGRGLHQRPLVEDIESLTVVDAAGEIHLVDRESAPAWFSLIVGGYGLFGVVTSVRLRLAPRQILRRHVSLVQTDELMEAFGERIAAGHLFGDCQFSIDERSPDFLRLGILSTYGPALDATAIPEGQLGLSREEWGRLLLKTHTDRAAAATAYVAHYTKTDGQLYWSDLHQRSEYIGGYHALLDRFTGASVPGSDIITEIYVPRDRLATFMANTAAAFREGAVPIVYGTIRLVERDDESVLAWAREPWACVIFNLHADHDEAGLAEAATGFRRLIDLGIAHGGSYYLTYHRFADRRQLEACHPRFGEFLEAKARLDPALRFQSDWYRHQLDLLRT